MHRFKALGTFVSLCQNTVASRCGSNDTFTFNFFIYNCYNNKNLLALNFSVVGEITKNTLL